MNLSLKCISIILISIMFLWSGVQKILHFQNKVTVLSKKTNMPKWLSSLGMIGVIILEILGFILLIGNCCKLTFPFLPKWLSRKQMIEYILLAILAFLIVVTFIYHPPSMKKPIPFLSNLSIFGAFLYIYADIRGD